MSAYTIDEVASPWRLDAERGAWRGIVEAEDLPPSQDFAWAAALWEVHAGGNDLLVLAVRERGRLVGIAPLRFETVWQKGVPLRLLRPLLGFYALHGTAFTLARPLAPAMDAVIRHLGTARCGWNVWRMSFWRDEQQRVVFEEILRRNGYRFTLEPGEQSPYLPLEGSWEAYLASRPAKMRSDLRSRERRLRAAGRLEFRMVGPTSDWRSALEDVYRVEAASWKSGRGTSITRSTHQDAFYRRYAELAAADGTLRLAVLTLDGEAIAHDYALYRRGVYYLLKTSYKSALRPYSPGVVLRKLVIERLCRDGAREVDFLGRPEPWKMRWTDLVREHVVYHVYNRGLRGQYRFIVAQAAHLVKARLGFRSTPPAHLLGKEPE